MNKVFRNNETKIFIYNWIGFFMALLIFFLLTGCSIPDLSKPNRITILNVPVTITGTGGGRPDARPFAGNNLSVFCKYHPNDPSCWSR